jgi:long-chain acyl-CoA synthetase
MIWGERSISYLDFLHQVGHYGSLIKAMPGDRIAIFSENRPEWIFALYAIWQKQATLVPIDHLSTAEEVAYLLNDSRPSVVFCSKAKQENLQSALKQSSLSPLCLVFEDLAEISPREAVPAYPEMEPDRVAVIMYTSGTTGSPKGVMLTFGNLMANIQAVSEEVPIFTSESRVLALLPFHHILPLVGCLLVPFYVGATTVIVASLSPEDLIRDMQKNRVTIIIGVPRFYSMIRRGIVDKINQRYLGRVLFRLARKLQSPVFSKLVFGAVHRKFGGALKTLVSGGAALDAEVGRDLAALGFDMLEGFGMTEAAPMITFPRPGRVKLGSCGQALPGLQVRIVDGEVTASGRNIMKGYYNKPQETAETLRDGWLYTGDLGYLDEDGYLFITGRKKEILVLPNGKKINPVEVEQHLARYSDAIKEVAVFMKDGLLHALVVPDFARITAQGITNIDEWVRWDVIDKYNRSSSPAKRIMQFTISKDELPKTRLNKIKRFQLEELAARSTETKGQGMEPHSSEYVAIRDYLQTELKKSVRPDDHLEIDLGMDSLSKISLQVFLQKTFGVNTDEKILAALSTVRRLADYVAERKTHQDFEAVNWTEILNEPVPVDLPRTTFMLPTISLVSRVCLKMYFRLRGEGMENIPASPFILAPNHQSYIDGLFVTSFLPLRVVNQIFFYAKEKHVRRKWMKFMADRNNVIVGDIEKDLKLSLQKMAAVLKSGRSLIIFPEGTRTRDGLIGSYKKTFAILAHELNIPVVPVSIQGAYEALPSGGRFPKPWAPVRVKFLPPVSPAGLTVDELREQVRQAALQVDSLI